MSQNRNFSHFWITTFALAKKEALCLIRDIHGLAALFIMPALFILIMTLVLQDALSYDRTPTLPSIGVYNAVPQALGHRQLQDKLVTELPAHVFNDEKTLRKAFTNGQIKVALLLQAAAINNPSDKPSSADTIPPLQLLMWVDDMTPPAVVATIRGKVAQFWGQQLPTLLSNDGDALTKMMMHLNTPNARLGQIDVQLSTRHQILSGHASPAIQRSVPGWLAFGMFFVVLPLAAVFVRERQQGTLLRLRLLNVPISSILLAKCLCYSGVNLLQCLVMLAVGRWLAPMFGAQALSLDFDGVALVLMIAAVSVAAVGMALAIAAWSRSVEQASTIGGAVNIILGALGGIMVPKMVMPVSMQKMTEFSPLGWANDGLSHIFLGGTAWREWLPDAGALLVFGAVMFILALWRLQSDINRV